MYQKNLATLRPLEPDNPMIKGTAVLLSQKSVSKTSPYYFVKRNKNILVVKTSGGIQLKWLNVNL
jgi:hypothetical protein